MIVDRGMNKEYAAIGGEASFGKLSAQLAFGDAAGIVADGRNVTVQAISGTGSLRCLATQFSHFCQLRMGGFKLVYFIGELSDRTYRWGSVTIKTKCLNLNCLI